MKMPASANVVVPEIAPVVGLIDRLAGKPVADHTNPSPSGSIAVGEIATPSPSSTVRSPSGVTSGARLVSATVRVKVAVSASAGFPSSVAVTVTGYTPASVNVVVPEITPVVGLIERPVGKPVADQVITSPSRSFAVGNIDTTSPSTTVRSLTGETTGARLVLVIVRTKFSVSLSAGLPLSVAVTVTGYTPASVNVVVPEIAPVAGLIDKLDGRPLAVHVVEWPSGSMAAGAIATTDDSLTV